MKKGLSVFLKNNAKYESLKTVEEKSVYIYTMQEGLIYRKLNIALTNDSDKELQSMMPLIRGINKYLTIGVKNDRYKVYRGGWLPKEYLKYFIKHSILRIPALWSCSKQKQVIKCFLLYLSLKYVNITCVFSFVVCDL